MAIAVLRAIKRDAKAEINFTNGVRFAPFFYSLFNLLLDEKHCLPFHAAQLM